ncbi:MAG: S8 family peptidase [Crocinitomicaceae bacterium]
MKKIIIGVSFVLATGLFGQVDKKELNWYNGKAPGMDTEKGYKKFLKNKKSTTVVVAVIDSGVDIEHEDLKGSIWKNEDEIPDNGIDDDKNGYIDDVYGWSYLGNKDGKDINEENLEMVRIYRKLHPKFDGKTADDIDAADKADYELYQQVAGEIEAEVKKYTKIKESYQSLATSIIPMVENTLKTKFGENYTMKDLEKWKVDENNMMEVQMKQLALAYVSGELTQEAIDEGIAKISEMLEYNYNVDFDARHIVGDNPGDFNDKSYGCNRVEGPDAMHGTHVSGIICATRGNGIGNDGVADNVQIMTLRAVPNGDERDKDIALAIRYAVDNGAKVINMSFGKSYSQYPEEVYEAMKYASENDVLMVHAAGNDNMNIDVEPNFPKVHYDGKADLDLVLTIGASTRYLKLEKEAGNSLAASFSNYGKNSVDIFAPGLEIYSTVPDDKYISTQGTSMAAPMVAGVAALIKSYYPNLTMKQVKQIILETGIDYSEQEVLLPGEEDKVGKFGTLSITGKVVNVYNALQKAEEMSK